MRLNGSQHESAPEARPGVGNVELVDVPEPACPPDGVKIEVAFTGICGTDLHVYHDTFKSYPPVVLGHEFSGTVAETGDRIRTARPGARVVVLGSTAVSCGACEHCRQGFYMFCPTRRGMGHGVSGSFTRFACAVQVDELAPTRAGDVALISGPGPIGLLCAMLLASRKCRVLVAGTDRDEPRLRLAERLGIYRAIDVTRIDLQQAVAESTGRRGADLVVEAAGAAASVAGCLRAVRKRGTYIQIGIHGGDVTVPLDLVLYKQIHMIGSLGHSLSSWDGVMRILAQRTVDLGAVVTHILPMSRWREAFDLCETKQAVKVLLHSDEP